jgi:hypothetical protein
MKRYDPDRAISPEDWTALDESERHHLVGLYHRKRRIKISNLRLHAAFHVIVENQLALGSKIPVQKVLARLMREGLTRHDAIHAVGSVLAGHIFGLIKHGAKGQDVNVDYYRQLEKLTAEGWLTSAIEESGEEDRK